MEQVATVCKARKIAVWRVRPVILWQQANCRLSCWIAKSQVWCDIWGYYLFFQSQREGINQDENQNQGAIFWLASENLILTFFLCPSCSYSTYEAPPNQPSSPPGTIRCHDLTVRVDSSPYLTGTTFSPQTSSHKHRVWLSGDLANLLTLPETSSAIRNAQCPLCCMEERDRCKVIG